MGGSTVSRPITYITVECNWNWCKAKSVTMGFHNKNELDAAAITQAHNTDKTIFRENDCDWNVGLRKKTGNKSVWWEDKSPFRENEKVWAQFGGNPIKTVVMCILPRTIGLIRE